MNKHRVNLFLILLSSLFYIAFIGNIHLFDWDEVNFAEISREMIITGDYLKVQVNFQPFFEKPPLFFWIQSLSMHIFGINEFAARLPNTLIGVITLILIYAIGNRLFNARFGFIWAMAFFGSILPYLYFKSGIIDPLFNLLIFLSIFFFIKFNWRNMKPDQIGNGNPPRIYLLISAIFIGLAMLAKGPVAFLILFLTIAVYWMWNRFTKIVSVADIILFSLTAFAVMFVWLGLETYYHGTSFMKEFFIYQIRLFTTHDAGHAGFPGFHVIVLLLGCFPASVFAIRGFYNLNPETNPAKDFRTWMIILFWVVLILFSIVQSKIIHYSSLAYFPLTFLAALVITRIQDGSIHFRRWMKLSMGVLFLLFILITSATPLIATHPEWIKPLFRGNVDALASLNAEIHWSGWEFIPGLLLFGVATVFFICVSRKKLRIGFRVLFGGLAIVVLTGLIFYAGRIEMYSQNANAEFCKSLQGKDCYITTSGFKSYIPMFYARPLPPVHERSTDIGWLTWDKTDKQVYIVAKVHLRSYWESVPTVEILYEKNGFIFIRRKS